MTVISNNAPLPAAVLWDMDGTLVDTEPYWMQAEIELVESYGGTWTDDDARKLVGNGLWVSAAVLQEHGVELDADTIVSRLTDRVLDQLHEHGVPWQPGARELLAELKSAGVPTALVTMSIERMARRIVDLIDFPAFDLIVAGDMVTHSKPHPEAYLTAAAQLHVDPAQCIAIEDSAPGLAAGVASGATAIGVPHLVALPEGPGHTLWPTLAGRTVADLAQLLAERPGSRNGTHTESAIA